jgi:hypothetical protein
MRTLIRICLGLAALLFAVSLVVGYFGAQQAIGRIPPDAGAGIGDAGRVGAEWLAIAMRMQSAALVLVLVSGVTWVLMWRRGRGGG